MNYIEALQRFLQNDPEISSLVGDRIGFARLDKNIEKPCIIFNEQERNPEILDWQDFESWIDVYPVLIDILVDYKDSIKWRELRQKIRKKLGNFKWVLSKKNDKILREWNINFIKFLACDYNQEVDWILRWGIYLFKNYYDNQNNELE